MNADGTVLRCFAAFDVFNAALKLNFYQRMYLFICLFVFILESVNSHNSDKHLKLLVNLTHLPRQSQLLNKMPVKHTNFFSKYKPVQALKDIFLFNGLSLE